MLGRVGEGLWRRGVVGRGARSPKGFHSRGGTRTERNGDEIQRLRLDRKLALSQYEDGREHVLRGGKKTTIHANSFEHLKCASMIRIFHVIVLEDKLGVLRKQNLTSPTNLVR